MTTTFIIAQVLGILGIIVNLLSLQFNRHFTILLMKTIGTLFFVVQYILLRAYVGMMMDIIGIIRNVLFTELVRRGKATKTYIIVFAIVIGVAGLTTAILSWNKTVATLMKNWNTNEKIATILTISISIISIVAKTLSTVSFGVDSAHFIRVVNIPAASGWFIYNLITLSITGMINEVFSISSSIIGEIRFRKKPTEKAKTENDE